MARFPTLGPGDKVRDKHLPDRLSDQELDSRYAPTSRGSTVFYDEFSRHANGPLAGKTPLIGAAWQTTGSAPTAIVDGRATSSDVGYAMAVVEDGRNGMLSTEVAFVGSAATMTMASCAASGASMLNNFVHFNFGPLGFFVTVRKDGGTFDPIMEGNWRAPAPLGINSPSRFGFVTRGNTVIIIGPNGETFAKSDPRIGQLGGNTKFWEPLTAGASQAFMYSASAVTFVGSGRPYGAADVAIDAASGFTMDGQGRVSGNRDGYNEVSIGRDDVASLPAVTYGPKSIRTYLVAAAASGATTIQTAEKFPQGSVVQIESGNNAETVTTTAPSAGSNVPYTTTVTATTKAHAANSAVVGTSPAGAQVSEYFNPENQWFYGPNAVLYVMRVNEMYLSPDLDTSIKRAAPGGGTPTGIVEMKRGIGFGQFGVVMTAGAGVPTGAGNTGDLYYRKDGAAGSVFYRCTATGPAGAAVWTALL